MSREIVCLCTNSRKRKIEQATQSQSSFATTSSTSNYGNMDRTRDRQTTYDSFRGRVILFAVAPDLYCWPDRSASPEGVVAQFWDTPSG